VARALANIVSLGGAVFPIGIAASVRHCTHWGNGQIPKVGLRATPAGVGFSYAPTRGSAAVSPGCEAVLHWLVDQQGNLRTVQMVEASFLGEAPLSADLQTPGLDDHFVESRELDAAKALRSRQLMASYPFSLVTSFSNRSG